MFDKVQTHWVSLYTILYKTKEKGQEIMLNLNNKADMQVNDTDKIINLDILEIIPNKQQPRTVFDDEKIADLAESIKEHGVIQPIVVRKGEAFYEIIAGERRYRAVKYLNLDTIPAIIKDYDDVTTASVAIIENIQREDLTSIEEAVAYRKLMNLHGITQAELANQISKSQSTIANKIRLLNLSQEVQDAILKRDISERHARTLLSVKQEDLQIKLLHIIIEKGLNVSQAEKLVEDHLTPKKVTPKATTITKIPRNIKLALNTFNQATMMVQKTGMNVETQTDETDDAFILTISLKK